MSNDRRLRRHRAVRLGAPALFVAALALLALWRVGISESPATDSAAGTSGGGSEIVGPITRLADVLAANVVGREASLDHVVVQRRVGKRAFWAAAAGRPVLAVAGEDTPLDAMASGAVVTLRGRVEAAPSLDVLREWGIDDASAWAVEDAGVYLHVREVRPAS